MPSNLVGRITSADGLRATVLVRLLVGAVFLSEGVQKFPYPDALGVGRFIGPGDRWVDVVQWIR
jgi:hypothetical protein